MDLTEDQKTRLETSYRNDERRLLQEIATYEGLVDPRAAAIVADKAKELEAVRKDQLAFLDAIGAAPKPKPETKTLEIEEPRKVTVETSAIPKPIPEEPRKDVEELKEAPAPSTPAPAPTPPAAAPEAAPAHPAAAPAGFL